jgi:hypothetical protein
VGRLHEVLKRRISMNIVPNHTYEAVDTSERERLLLQLEAEHDNLRYAQSGLEIAARDIAILIETAQSNDDLVLAADEATDLAGKLRRLAKAKDEVEKALGEMG